MNLDDLKNKNPKIKYACTKLLIKRVESDPRSLYPKIEFFIDLSDDENHILQWTAIDVLGGIGTICSPKDREKILKLLYQKLNCGKMITAGHATKALGNIAIAKPQHRDEIIAELLKVEKYTYDTSECRNIAIGHVIEVLGDIGIEKNDKTTSWLKKQTKNTRKSTTKKAEKLLKEYANEPKKD